MAKGRMLTGQEMQKVRAWALAREQRDHPDATIAIIVHHTTDENGKARYSAVITEDRVVRLDEISS